MPNLAIAIKQTATQLGFDHCRIVPVEEAAHANFFDEWLALGRAGEMTYLERNREKRRQPQLLAELDMPPFRSLIVLAVNHYQFALPKVLRDDPSRGLIASYAWGDDYHEIIRPRLYELDAFICKESGRNSRGKCLVDTGPVLERDWAQRAGMGFTGKNCCTIHPQEGSWLLLATLMVPEVLDYDQSLQVINQSAFTLQDVVHGLPGSEHLISWHVAQSSADSENSPTLTCGRCIRCLDACPTDAFVGPFHLDPLRCISYWTIEAKKPIPRSLRPHFGNRIFGCDICQEVCPWNQRLPERTPLMAGLTAQQERIAPPLLEGFDPTDPYWLDQDAFSRRFRRSPIKRAKRRGMLRNVCVALGNWADPETIEPLRLALNDPEPLPRGHAAWALGQVYRKQRNQQHQVQQIMSILQERLHCEQEPWVIEEIQTALKANS